MIPRHRKTCDNINSGASSEPVITDSLSQVLETLWYLDALSNNIASTIRVKEGKPTGSNRGVNSKN